MFVSFSGRRLSSGPPSPSSVAVVFTTSLHRVPCAAVRTLPASAVSLAAGRRHPALAVSVLPVLQVGKRGLLRSSDLTSEAVPDRCCPPLPPPPPPLAAREKEAVIHQTQACSRAVPSLPETSVAAVEFRCSRWRDCKPCSMPIVCVRRRLCREDTAHQEFIPRMVLRSLVIGIWV